MGERMTDKTNAASIPDDVIDEAERLTRLARAGRERDGQAVYRKQRATLLDKYDYTARFREADETLVLYPTDWVENGTVHPQRIDDTSRAVEVPLVATAGEDQFSAVEAHNSELVAAVESEHGPVHGANARAFADFLGNHYLIRVETATADHLTEFITEYYLRNAWPSKKQRAEIETSLQYLFAVAETECPERFSE